MYNKFCDIVYQVENLSNNKYNLLYIEEYILDDIRSSDLTSAALIFEQI